MNDCGLTKVFEIDHWLVVADSIEEAISLYGKTFPRERIREVRQVSSTGVIKNYDAMIAKPVTCSCNGWELTHITFTGVDGWTDIDRLVDIQERYPLAEFGVLLSKNWLNNGNRFPSPEMVEKLRGRGLHLSGHLCGSLAKNVLHMGGFANVDFEFARMLDIFLRVHLNVSCYEDATSFGIRRGPIEEVIIQQGESKSLFEQCRLTNGEYISLLLDKSGGMGIDTRIEFPPYASRVHLGFAGGINPDNVIDKLHQITSSPCIGDFWIDMESGVRTDDRFDLDKVENVCKKVYDTFLATKS